MLTPSQIALLTTRSTGPWPSAGVPPPGLFIHLIHEPNPLSGAPPGVFEIRDHAGRFITWTGSQEIVTNLLALESQGYGTVLALLNGGAYKPQNQIPLDLEGLRL